MKAYKAYLVLLTVAFVGLASEAVARSSWCGQFARHNLVNSDPGSKYNLACNWKNWGRPTSPQVGDGDLVLAASPSRWQDSRPL